MFVYRSNRMEALVAALCRVVSEPVVHPFEPETIVVQSRGIERWVSLRVARALGACANFRFPFPRAFIDEMLDAVLAEDPEGARRFARERLTWTLAALVPELLGVALFEPVKRYLGPGDDPTRRLQFCRRLAHAFDQLVVYRPELVLGWEHESGDDWQAALWQAVVRRLGRHHLAARAERFTRSWPDADLQGLPARVCVFGASSLPPLFVRLLAVLGQRIEMHLFLFSPSREYWASTPSVKRSVRDRAYSRRPAFEEDLLASEAHPLLALWGRTARDMQEVLESSVDYVEPDSDLYVDPGPLSLLTALQSDILALRAPGRDTPRHVLEPGDSSISVHCCHSARREIEVVHDQLLDAFSRDATLEPDDVLVMVPDIDAYAPLIDAEFGGGAGRVPYRIADRTLSRGSELVRSFLALLDLMESRMKVSQVLSVLEQGPVLRRLGLTTEDAASMRRWVQQSGIRWGLDAESRQQQGVPASLQNTWRFGINRLLLGYAMPGSRTDLFAGVLPYDDVEGQQAVRIGQFVDWCEKLFVWRRRFDRPRTVPEWAGVLTELVDDLLEPSADERAERRAIRDGLLAMAQDSRAAEFTEPVDLRAMRWALADHLGAQRQNHQFLTGHTVFCEMLPMRSIPFRVICVVGMQDGKFPRSDRPFCLEPMVRQPRVGDRSVRDEDRGLFLEALLSARDRWIITYAGRDPEDNSRRPPSVVVSELLAILDETFSCGAAQGSSSDTGAAASTSSRVVVDHPLHAFSPRYFGVGSESVLFSYSASNAELARVLRGPARDPAPFVARLLPPAREPRLAVSVASLVRFFMNPARFLLEDRLGISLTEEQQGVSDRQPVVLGPLERHDLGSELLLRVQRDEPRAQSLSVLRAEGILPEGRVGDALFERLANEAATIDRLGRRWRFGEPLPDLPVDIVLGSTRLTGVLEDLWPSARVEVRYSRISAARELSIYLHHLVLCAAEPEALAQSSVLVGRPPEPLRGTVAVVHAFGPVARDRARALLEGLLGLYELGQRAPLSLFPASSLIYCRTLRKMSGDRDADRRALDAARRRFEGTRGLPFPAERDDPYIRVAFGQDDPLDVEPDAGRPSFRQLSVEVFGPLLDHRQVLEP